MDDLTSFLRARAAALPPTYSAAPLYCLRATRSSADGESRIVGGAIPAAVGIRSGVAHALLLRDPHDHAELLGVAERLSTTLGLEIVFKKLPRDVAQASLRSSPRFGDPCTGDRSLAEDEAYPEASVELGLLVGAGSDPPKALRAKLRQFATGADLPVLQLMDGAAARAHALEALASLARTTDVADAYSSIVSHLAQPCETLDPVDVALFCEHVAGERIWHGLYISQGIAENVAGLYCALTSRARSGITEHLDAWYFSRCRDRGIENLLLGGSETAGVFDYVTQKLRPTIDHARVPLTFALA